MTHRLLSLMFALAFAVSCGCGDPDSGLTKTQVTQMLEIEQATQLERADLSLGRDQLETDRRQWSERERSDPVIAEAIGGAVLVVVCCLPLLLIVLLVLPTKRDVSAELICEAFIGASSETETSPHIDPTNPRGRLD